MGKGDRRNSNKMLQRRSRLRFKSRNSRPKMPARQPVVAKAEAPAKEPEASE